MHPRLCARLVAAFALVILAAPLARAGQVRVDIGSFFFSPSSVSLNQGDHVVWVWVAGGHSTTSGSPPGTPNGIWDSATLAMSSAFTWKSNVSGTVPYYCTPHFSTMQATLQIGATGAAVSNFRITEVHYTAAAGEDRIQITNMGNATGDLGRYRVTSSATSSGTTTATLPGPNITVLASASVTLHWGKAGINTSTDIFLTGLSDLGNTGSIGLYAPNTKTGQTAFTIANMVIDYVEWGAAAQANEATASAATADGTTVWTSGMFVNGETLPAYSISFCGAGNQHGDANWQISTPNFGGSPICATPTIRTTWGRLKTLYR